MKLSFYGGVREIGGREVVGKNTVSSQNLKKSIDRSNVLLIACVVLLGASIVGDFWLYDSLLEAKDTIRALENSLAEKILEIANLQSEMALLEEHRDSLQLQLEKALNESCKLADQVATLTDRVSMLKEKVGSLNVEIHDKNEVISDLEAALQRYQTTGYVLSELYYNEVLQFIYSDDTDLNHNEDYTCFNFAADVKSNAYDKGYKCGLVYIEFPSGAHAIVVFDTIDKGLVYVEPQTDEIVRVEIGRPYWDRDNYLPPTYDDTIIYFAIVW